MAKLKDIEIEKFRNVPFKTRTHCVVCNEKLGKPLIELPKFPMSEVYTSKKPDGEFGLADQYFHFCENCGMAQLQNVIDTDLQYGDSIFYYFRTSESSSGKASADYFVNFLRKVVKDRKFGNITEIGANDLYVLKEIKDIGKKLVGIDPILKGKEEEFSSDNVIAVGDFFENVELKDKIDLFICKDTLEHVDEPKEFTKKIVDKGHDDTLFIFHFPILETILDDCRFDQVFHQHLNYYTLQSIIHMLDNLGCDLVDYDININHWGAISIAFKKGKNSGKFAKDVRSITNDLILERYEVFKKNMKVTSQRLEAFKGHKIYGYGAANMLPVLSYHLDNGLSDLEFVVDDDKQKDGKYYVNMPIMITTPDKMEDIENSIVLVTAISAKQNLRGIVAKLVELNPKQIIVPINSI